MRPEAPQALHLIRLAQGSPGQWVALPGGALRVLALTARLDAQQAHGWMVCLRGEAVLDLPDGDFVRLRPGEGFELRAAWAALPTRDDTVLLLVPS